MNPFTYQISFEIAKFLNGGSLPAEVLATPPSTDPLGDINMAFQTGSAEFLNSLNLPGIPEFHFR